MASTDVSGVAGAVSGLQIDGPAHVQSAKVELNDEDVTRILPGEIDPMVGRNTVPPQRVTSSEDGKTATVVERSAPIEIDLDADDADEQIQEAARETLRRTNPDLLFDPSPYTDVPAIDGHPVDELVFSLSGTVKHDANSEEAQELFESLRLGKPVNITVSAYVATKQGGYKEDARGNPLVTGKVGLKLLGLGLVPPEAL